MPLPCNIQYPSCLGNQVGILVMRISQVSNVFIQMSFELKLLHAGSLEQASNLFLSEQRTTPTPVL